MTPKKSKKSNAYQWLSDTVDLRGMKEYVAAYFKTVDPDSASYDLDFFKEVYHAILTAKRDHVALNSLSEKPTLPNKLDTDDIACILFHLYDFKTIYMSESSKRSHTKQSTLGVYVDHHTGFDLAGYGTYEIADPMLRSLTKSFEQGMTSLKKKDDDEILYKLSKMAETVDLTRNRHLVPVKNGVFNKQTKELEPFSPEYVFLTKIMISYDASITRPILKTPEGDDWDIDHWLFDLMGKDRQLYRLIWQVLSDVFQPNYSRGRSIWFYSKSGNSGKGTLGQLIKNILGKGNYSSLNVAQFKDKFAKGQLVHATANIADENDVDVYIDSISDFKATITGDDITIEQKYELPFSFQFLGTNIQMMNGLPKTKDKTDSLYRRLVIVPFIHSFTDNGERKYIKDEFMYDEATLQYVLKRALETDFTEYIIPSVSRGLLDGYKESNNPILQYWIEFENQFQWDLLPTQFLYDLYLSWFSKNNPNGSALGKQTFIDELKVLAANSGVWKDKTGRSDNVRSKGKMDADEPLITEYNLFDWMNHKGRNDKTKRQFTRKPKYRGLTK